MRAASGVTVERVRLRGAGMDAAAARQRLSYLLSSVTLRPSRMAPSAVLVVRSMRDPLPGAIARPFASAAFPSPAWERAAEARLDALGAEAARPARSPPPQSAEAVLFADTSELLACLALDLSTGAGLAWWWKSSLRRHLARGFAATSDLWPLAWAEQPRYAPAAMQWLDERKQAARLLERIAPMQAWRLLLTIAQAFGLPVSLLNAAREEAAVAPAARAGTRGPTAPAEVSSAAAEIGMPMAPGRQAPSGGRPDSTAPWEPHVPPSAVPRALGIERRALLGVSLLLHRAPRQAESPRFAPRLRSWLAAERALGFGNDTEGAATSPPRPRSRSPVDPVTAPGAETKAAESTTHTQAPPSPRPGEGSTPDREGPAQSQARSDAAAPSRFATEAPLVSILAANDRAASGSPIQDPNVPALAPYIETPPLDRKRTNFPEARMQFEGGCPTSLGGVFYLVHVLLRSELLAFDVGLRGWALLELLARCLLHPAWSEVADDPVWDALALLDFREPGSHPGADFAPLPAYEAPESWLRGLQGSKRYARFRSGRLELWHEEGFLELDTTAQIPAQPFARVTRRRRRVFRRDAGVCAGGFDLAPELRRFLHFLLPYARWRLRRAVAEASLADILRRKGTLYITPSHVDVVMGMAEISLPARIAGLDANPGWTPKLGRVIKFHFVDDFDGGGR